VNTGSIPGYFILLSNGLVSDTGFALKLLCANVKVFELQDV
jgi:hypothetical protein